MKNKKILWITQTAIYIALLVVLQMITKPLGQFVTGSVVNFVLLASCLSVGLLCGITNAILSPFFAFMLGIGPTFIQMVPFIAVGNLVIVLVYWAILGRNDCKGIINWVLSIVVGAGLKFVVLWYGITSIAIPMIGTLKEQQINVLSATFSYPQLITALIGGVLTALVVPVLRKALKGFKS